MTSYRILTGKSTRWTLRTFCSGAPKGPKSQDGLKSSLADSKAAVFMSSKMDDLKKLLSDRYNDWSAKKTSSSGEEEWYTAKVSFWMKRYENFVGLTEVKSSQARVVKEEQMFVASQEERRATQAAINDVQAAIKALHSELERTSRGEDKYLTLITREHNILKEEKGLTLQLLAQEKAERRSFARLSNAVRDSHEKERAQAEKTKYWSVIGSVVGTCLGVIGTTVNNRMRMRELRQIVRDSTGGVAAAAAGASVTLVDHNSRLSDLSRQVDTVSQEVSGKLETLSGLVNELKVIPEMDSGNKHEVLAVKTSGYLNELKKSVDKYHKSLEARLDQFQSSFIGHNKSLVETLSLAISKRDDKFIEALRITNSSAYENFSSKTNEIDEKIKDIRSLILAQSMAANDGSIQASISSSASRNETAKALERTNRSIVGTVELALKDHESKLRSQMALTGLVMVIVTPLLVLAANRLL